MGFASYADGAPVALCAAGMLGALNVLVALRAVDVFATLHVVVEFRAVGVCAALLPAGVLVALRMDFQSWQPIGTVGFPRLNARLGWRLVWECAAQLARGKEGDAVQLSWRCSSAVGTGVVGWMSPAAGWLGACLTPKNPSAASFAV